MEAKAKSRPFKKLYCDWRSRIFLELTSAELKVWLYHYLRSGKDDSSHPKLYTISKDTNLHQNTVKAARKGLRNKGWLVSKRLRGAKGRFAVPEETAVIPPQDKICATVPTAVQK